MKDGIVYLVGAGPGDPGLMTVRGLDCLRRADVVVYDYLANPEFLKEAPPAAEHIYVGKSRGRHHAPQEEINALLAERARDGKVVVRLKGGDPYVFGRGGEEALYLQRQGLAFEVVPGVTAGFAAAAYAGIPLTHRDFTTSLALITGHEDPDKKISSLDWSKLATGLGTLVFYMGMSNLSLIVRELTVNGRSSTTPVAVVQWATTPRQRTVTGTLDDIAARVQASGIKPPAIIIVGEVVSMRDHLQWFENRPLFGRRIVVTRTAEQAGKFNRLLEEQGAAPISCPVIEIAPPESWHELDEEISRLSQTDYLVLTSANGVEMFFGRLRQCGLDLRALSGVKVVSVGPRTAAAIEAEGIKPDLVPEEFRAEAVVAMLIRDGVAGRRVLYPKAELAREVIPTELAAAGAVVAAPVAYRTVAPQGGGEEMRRKLEAGEVDAVTFTSSSTVENFLAMLGPAALDLLEGVVIVSIGPLTSATARRLGLKVHVEPKDYTLEGMVAALIDYFRQPEDLRS